VVALLDHLAVGPVDWLGTSMGGILGMLMAGHFPDRVRRLVLNDVGAWIPAAGLRRILSYAGKTMRYASRPEAEAALRSTFATFGMRTEATWQVFFDASLVDAGDGSVRLAYDPAIVSSTSGRSGRPCAAPP
jgi:pimeloyl-ACP methyl ester carboxylesterase